MKRKLFKAVAACAAVCFVSGLMMINGGFKSEAADNYIFNYNFDDGAVPEDIVSSAKLELVDGMNSNFDAMLQDPNAPADTNGACVKVTNRNGYWETSGLSCSTKDMVEGKKYDISFDIYHENKETEKYNSNRAVVIKGMDHYLHIEGPYPSLEGYWERIAITYEHKQRDTYVDGKLTTVSAPHTLFVEFAYPEPYEDQGDVFKDANKEEYYIDNFSIKEHVDATPTPVPTATPVPTPAPTAEPALPPVAEGPELEVGYEEAIKGITYKVTGLDTVTVVGFDLPKNKLTIPDTIVLEEYAYKVTAIANNAFKGESIKNLTIGANVTTIGKNAFANCKSLKKVTIKSTVIKSIGKNAFKKTNAKATFKVPKAKKKAYKKLLKKAGIAKKAKVK